MDIYTICAHLSEAVYMTDSQDETTAAEAIGYRIVENIAHNDTQATLYVPRDPTQNPILAFRGTEFMDSWKDFWRNVGLPVEWAGPGKAHSGYLRGYNQVRDEVLEIVHCYPNLVFTGHSLGGATAALAGVHAQYRGFPRQVVTFGSPGCLNKVAAAYRTITRFTIKNDFAQWVGIPIFTHQKSHEVLPKVGFWPVSLKAHKDSNYKDALKKMTEN